MSAGNGAGTLERRRAAIDAYRASVAQGAPLNARQLGEAFDRSRTWARQVIAETAAAEAPDGGSHEAGTEVPSGTLTPAETTAEPKPAARWQARVTAIAVLVVAGVAALISYSHMRSLAMSAGEDVWAATLLPFSVDGMLACASMTALVRKRTGRSVGFLPWAALLLGVAASVAANIASAEPTVTGRAIAAWPPVALLVSLELLLRQTRGTGQ